MAGLSCPSVDGSLIIHLVRVELRDGALLLYTMKVPVLLYLMLACVHARMGDKCQQQAECDAGECCQILSMFPVVSKTQDVLNVFPAIETNQGTCQLYKLEGARCNSFEHMNGYCGCGPNLTCHGEEVKVADVGRRSMIAPHPGYMWEFKCTPAATATH